MHVITVDTFIFICVAQGDSKYFMADPLDMNKCEEQKWLLYIVESICACGRNLKVT